MVGLLFLLCESFPKVFYTSEHNLDTFTFRAEQESLDNETRLVKDSKEKFLRHVYQLTKTLKN